MKYELPPDVEQQLKERVASGRYASEADVLRDALAALESRDQELAAIQAGIDDMEAGRVRPFNEVDAEIREHFGFSKAQ
jgi:putative addiction module CopG family antidote